MFLKYLSRSVHEEQCPEKINDHQTNTKGLCELLTVWRKSLLISCSGFTVIDSNGNLVFRVDNYILRPQEIVLMDGLGKSVLTLRRSKKLSLIDSWLIYEGDQDMVTKLSTKKKPSFKVSRRNNINMFQANHENVLAQVHRIISDKTHVAYVVEGSYANRSCKILDESRRVVAEIKSKEAINVRGGGVSFGLDVFTLILHHDFDSGFAMALVLLLDQMFS
ncbi:hypothetical protein ACFE04_015729 [Oxalis oulophora]